MKNQKEFKPKLIKYEEKMWKDMFPYTKGLDYSQLLLSNIGKFSMTYHHVGDEMAKIIRKHVKKEKVIITDATANVGGNIYSFVKFFDKVNAVEVDTFHCNILYHNLKVYKIKSKVKIYCNNYLDISDKLKQDVIFIDAPWGGSSYKKYKDYKQYNLLTLYLDKKPIYDIIKPLIKKSMVVLKVPYNFDFKTVYKLCSKLYIYPFYKSNCRLLFYMIVIESKM